MMRVRGRAVLAGLMAASALVGAPMLGNRAGATEELSLIPDVVDVDCERGEDLQGAIDSARAGTTLWVSGTCRGNFLIEGVLTLRGVPKATLATAGTGTTLTVGAAADALVSGLTILGGTGTLIGEKPSTQIGGGVVNHGHLVLRDVVVRGGALLATLVTDVGGAQGAGIWNDGILLAARTTITANEARALSNEGGGLYNSGSAELLDSVVSANVASGLAGRGGGIFNATAATLQLRRTRIDKNTASGRVGGGGGLANAGTARIEGSAIVGNTAGGLAVTGGGIANGGTLVLRRVDLSANQAVGSVGVAGGGLANQGVATLERVWVTANSANGSVQPAGGGGLAGLAGTLVVRRSVVGNNTPDNCTPTLVCNETLAEADD